MTSQLEAGTGVGQDPPSSATQLSSHVLLARAYVFTTALSRQLSGQALLLTALALTLKFDLGFFSWAPFAGFVALSWRQIYAQQADIRTVLFDAIISEDSWIQWFRNKNALIATSSFVVALTLATAVAVAVVTSSWTLLLLFSLPLSFGPKFLSTTYRAARNHLKPASARVIACSAMIGGTATMLALLMIISKWQGASAVPSASLASAGAMADHVIERTHHGLFWIQHLARAQAMFDLELLRARTLIASSTTGNAVYIYYLLPSTLAAVGFAVALCGILRPHLLTEKGQ